MEAKTVTGTEYEEQYIPLGGFLFIKKDMAPTSSGKIIIAETIREDHSKFTSMGVIISKSPFGMFDEIHDEYVFTHLSVGDRIGYSATVPLYAPSPPFYTFEGDDKEAYITIHMRDVLCVLCDTPEKKAEFLSRFEGEM